MAQNVVVLASVFVSLTVVSTAVRMYTRVVILRNLGSDDYLICVGAVFAILCSVAPLPAIKYGLGKPTAEQTPEDFTPYQKLMLTSSVAYSVAAMLIKLSLLSFYTRLSPNRAFRMLVYVMIFVVIGFGIGSIMTVLLQCRPLSALWIQGQFATAKCIKITDFYYANSALNITTDVIILLLPIKILWGLHMPLRQRVSLLGLFGMGGLACIASIIRLTSIHRLLSTDNPTIKIVMPLNWSIVELNVSVLVAGAPAFKAFLRHCVPSLLGSSYAPTGTIQYGSRSRHTHAGSIPLGSTNDKSGTVWRGEISANPGPQDGGQRVNHGSREGSQDHILVPSYHGILQEVTVSVKSERRSMSAKTEDRERDQGNIDF